ncbi:ABC transporter substrate-binding protein [Actinocrispum wychmicini]|uniref:Multiple sugar transport system substrate-binding protein n=1 Tax=Actinocrispum wychmicini TaxID=1213861 RepID=A0A4R2IU46_9PSEU|nr:extracellular solute-binding protein [Actinocrispum wychmicini]TCO48824.1 multiple sugar transport system substrate-binding protein [Actinocrispum wychmicini]
MRTVRAWGAVIAVTVALTACSVKQDTNNAGGTGDRKEVSFLTFETPNLTPAYWDAAIKRVTDSNPDIKVTKLVAPTTQGRTDYAKQLLQSGQFPDVMIAVDPAGFAEAGNLYDWKPEELKDFQFPSANPIKGGHHQLPANTQTIPPVYYNKKMFADAGVTGTPKTWADLLDAAAKLKAKGLTPFVTGGGKDGFPAAMIMTGVVSVDVYGKTPDWLTQRRADKVKFSDPLFTAAVAKFADLAAKGYIDKDSVSRDYAATEQAFLDGKGAMYPMGNWFAANADTKKHDFDIGVFNFPTDDGRLVVPAYTGGGMSVNAHAKNLDAAKRFALAFQTDKQQIDVSVKADGLVPAIKGYQMPADIGPVLKAGYDLYQEAVDKNAVVNSFGWETADDGLLPGMKAKFYAVAQDVITGRKSVADACAFLDTEWAKAK